MESIGENKQVGTVENLKSVESQVNREGLDTLFLLERLRHPVIRRQIIDTLDHIERSKKGEFIVSALCDEKGEVKRDKDGDPILHRHIHVPCTIPELQADYDKSLQEISSQTPVRFADEQPTKECMTVGWKNPHTGKELTTRQMAVAEAHEKGHVIRPYAEGYLRDYFGRAFDLKAVKYSMEDYWHNYPKKERQETGYEEARLGFFHYLFSPSEIAERMAQIKNYFSMRGDEKVTKEHLDYARKHYVEDIGFDNQMSFFFQAITPEKEEAFLNLINSAGI